MASNVTEKDKGWNSLKKTLGSIGKKEVVVGIPGPIDFSGPSTGALGAVHEFGSTDGSIPERSFLRSTFDQNRSKYNKTMSKAVEAGLKRGLKKGKADEAALFQVGEVVRADVINRIDKREIRQDLKPATIARKGSDTALVDTGGLRGSIVSVVREKKGA